MGHFAWEVAVTVSWSIQPPPSGSSRQSVQFHRLQKWWYGATFGVCNKLLECPGSVEIWNFLIHLQPPCGLFALCLPSFEMRIHQRLKCTKDHSLTKSDPNFSNYITSSDDLSFHNLTGRYHAPYLLLTTCGTVMPWTVSNCIRVRGVWRSVGIQSTV